MQKTILALSLSLLAGAAMACGQPTCPATGTTSSNTATETGASGYVQNGVSVSVENGGSALVTTAAGASSSATATANATTVKNGDCCSQSVGGALSGNTTSNYNAFSGVNATTTGNATVAGESKAGAASFGDAQSTIAGKLANDAGQFGLTVGSGAGAGGSVTSGVNQSGSVSGSSATQYTGAAGVGVNKCLGTTTGFVTKLETVSLPSSVVSGNATATSGASGSAYGAGSYNVGAKYGTFAQ